MNHPLFYNKNLRCDLEYGWTRTDSIGSRLIFVARYKTDSQKVQRTEIVVLSNRCYGALHLESRELSIGYKY